LKPKKPIHGMRTERTITRAAAGAMRSDANTEMTHV
jgi:hypothetical protein